MIRARRRPFICLPIEPAPRIPGLTGVAGPWIGGFFVTRMDSSLALPLCALSACRSLRTQSLIRVLTVAALILAGSVSGVKAAGLFDGILGLFGLQAPVEAKPADALDASGKPAEPAQRPPEVAPPAGPTANSTITANPEPQKPAAFKAEPDSRPNGVSPAGGFVVQLAAFADAKAAPALASKLKTSGFPAYTETLKTPQGTIRRVRVGPYATREVADAELAKLNAAGYRGVVTTR